MKASFKIIPLMFFGMLVVINIWMFIFSAQPWFVSALNIFFHEAGHWIFSFFGRYIEVLGGTLGELLIPTLFILYFRKRMDVAGQIFSWWWFSTALYDISIYVADARARVLPLIGGQGGHDWAYLLGQINMLKYDFFISGIFLTLFLYVTVYLVLLIRNYYLDNKSEKDFVDF